MMFVSYEKGLVVVLISCCKCDSGLFVIRMMIYVL